MESRSARFLAFQYFKKLSKDCSPVIRIIFAPIARKIFF